MAQEGRITVEDGYGVWFRVAGEPGRTPVLVLHGGPGSGHDYLVSLEWRVPLLGDRVRESGPSLEEVPFMPFAYAPEYREMVLEQVRAGRLAVDLAKELEVSEATIHRYKAQDEIDRGVRPGRPTGDSAELRSARRRIAEPETELAAAKRASELFDEGRVVRPKARCPVIAQLAVEGHSTKAMCRLLRVAPSGFFRWKIQPPSPRQLRRAWLTNVIVQIWEESRRTYGARRVRAELGDAHGQNVNLKLVRSIMREQGIAGLPARRRYKRSDSNRYTSTDLVNRAFSRDGPNQLWMTDITEHPTT